MLEDLSPPYDVVLADPPWSYYGAPDKWGAAAKFYPTMATAEIADLPVHDLLADRAVVFVWTTSAKLPDALELLSVWKLAYRGIAFVWVKITRDGVPIGAQGVRPSITKPLTELVVVGSTVLRGRPLPLASEAVCQTVFAPKAEHSAKPAAVQERIELMYPTARKLELFARRRRPGWDAWGDEVA
ncbi:MAG: MT-A70 family methyltransferase [Actinomycetota bacterium]|nr:MT-A70 family methyltransferase [Actinomycetota bacterium]